MKIAAYCRVSTDKDAQIESLHNQELFFTEFAKKYNHELIKIYADEGISGKQMKNRTQFLKMLKDAKLHTFELIVVKDISRFARNTVDFLNSVRELKSENIEVQFLSTNQTILGGSEFILTIFSALAQEESANLSKRVKFGLGVSAKKGKVPTIIYGYDIVNAQTLTINETEAKVVKDIFDMYVNQGLGTRKIGLILDEKGIPTKKGAKWIPRTIRRMLMNSIYAGLLENHKYETTDFLSGKKVERPKEEHLIHERPKYQIVSKDIFDKAQIILKQRQKLYQNDSTHMTGHYSNKYLFSTLIKCDHCGYSFCRRKFTTKKSGEIVYWKCSGNNNRTSLFCPNTTTVSESWLIENLKSYLHDIIKNPDKKKQDIINDLVKRHKDDIDKIDINSATKQLNKIKSQEDKYKIMFANDIIGIDELKSSIKNLEQQKTELQTSIEQQQILSDKFNNKNSIIDNYFKKLEKFYNLKDWTNEDVRKIISHISVNKDGDVTFHLTLTEDLLK